MIGLFCLLILAIVFRGWIGRLAKKVEPRYYGSFGALYRTLLWRISWRSFAVTIGLGFLAAFGTETPEAAGGVVGGAIAIYFFIFLFLLLAVGFAARNMRKEFMAADPVPVAGDRLTVARAIDRSHALPLPPRSFYVHLPNGVKGPFSTEQLRALISVGTVSPATQCCIEGTQDWQPVSEFV